jgi:hypothetical protein
MNFLARFKRVPGAPWFALIAGVHDSEPAGTTDPEMEALMPFPDTAIKDRKLYTARSRGDLVLAANDAAWAYGNNHGRVLVTLSLRDGPSKCS